MCQLFLVSTWETRRLLGVTKIFGQMRSGTGDASALGYDLPRIRTLDENLYCCPQARPRTLPGLLGNREMKRLHIKMRC
jgi:hypothetical protein